VSSNGWIGFSAGQTNGYTAQFLPNGGAPKNAILADWEDLLPNTGNMNYYTTGLHKGNYYFKQLLIIKLMKLQCVFL
jgi:hypothetical protein